MIQPSYNDVHVSLRNSRGRASEHSCLNCGGAAKDWAYQHNSLDELFENGAVYSTDLACYEPMCRKCHRALDMFRSNRLSESLRQLGLSQVVFLANLRESDPEFAEKMRLVGSRLGQYTVDRRKADPEFADMLRANATRNIWIALAVTRSRMSDPDYALKVSQDRAKAARVANRKRWKCGECEVAAHAAAVGAHQKGSGHRGRTLITNGD